jgi:hypothetical protein
MTTLVENGRRLRQFLRRLTLSVKAHPLHCQKIGEREREKKIDESETHHRDRHLYMRACGCVCTSGTWLGHARMSAENNFTMPRVIYGREIDPAAPLYNSSQ